MQRVGLFLALTTALALAAPVMAADPAGATSADRMQVAARDPAADRQAHADSGAPAGQRYGAEEDARIQIRVIGDSWITVRDASDAKIFSRMLHPGDVYHVPAQPGLRLFAGRPEKLRASVDGQRIKVYDHRRPSLDEIALDPDALVGPARGTSRRDLANSAKPSTVADAAPVPKPLHVAAVGLEAPIAQPISSPAASDKPASGEAVRPETEEVIRAAAAALSESAAPAPMAAVPVIPAASPQAPAAAETSADPAPLVPAPPAVKTPARTEVEPAPMPPVAEPPVAAVAPVPQPAAPAPSAARALIQTAAAPTPIAPPMPASLTKPVTAAAARTAATPAPAPIAKGAQATAPVRDNTAASGEVTPNGRTLQIEVGKGTLVRLRRPATTVFVANPEIADVQVKSPGLIYIAARQTGDTVLYAVDDKDQVLLSATVRVNHNLTRLREALRAALPTSAIEVNSVDGALMLMGAVESAQKAEEARRIAARYAPGKGEVINQLKVVAPNQIHIRVRFAEVSRETLNQLGFNWNAVLNTGTFLFGIATGNPVIPAAGLFTTLRDAGDGNINSYYGRTTRGNLDLNTLIDALGKEDLITILAEPNLTALSGETASFLAGGEFPVPVPQDANTITIMYKRFGVALDFVPTLLDGDRINLKVRPEVSQLTNTGAIRLASFDIPALTVRRAETTIELGSGQSFAIAGLLKRDTEEGLSKTPGIGDVPVLGALFRSDRYNRKETELVILVTPYVVRPVSNRMAAPTDGMVPPNDVERIIGGQNYKEQIKGRGQAPAGPNAQGLVGPAGFALD